MFLTAGPIYLMLLFPFRSGQHTQAVAKREEIKRALVNLMNRHQLERAGPAFMPSPEMTNSCPLLHYNSHSKMTGGLLSSFLKQLFQEEDMRNVRIEYREHGMKAPLTTEWPRIRKWVRACIQRNTEVIVDIATTSARFDGTIGTLVGKE
jgi:hypothetical protein